MPKMASFVSDGNPFNAACQRAGAQLGSVRPALDWFFPPGNHAVVAQVGLHLSVLEHLMDGILESIFLSPSDPMIAILAESADMVCFLRSDEVRLPHEGFVSSGS